MTGILQCALGAAMALAAWLVPRRIARTPLVLGPALALDAAPLLLGALLLAIATGRPVFAGLIILGLGAGFALADQTMRDTLREPVVFSESVELPQLFSHPHLYLPFAGPALVIGGALAIVAAALALLVFEPPVWRPDLPFALAAVALIAGTAWALGRQPLLSRVGAAFRRLGPSGDPDIDAAALGPFAMVLTHCAIARAERTGRRTAIGAPAIVGTAAGSARPIVLVQCESFFDARRLTPEFAPLLPGYAACCNSGLISGRLVVPGWGANTMRTEFAVLSGVAEEALGYDRFNPYYALARAPLASQVWRLRAAGYRAICLHPFDRRFFRRDLAMPALGFDAFYCSRTLGGARRPPYFADPDLAREILRVLDAEGPRCFLFAITMGNHGPWSLGGPPIDPAVSRGFDPGGVPQGAELERYLDGLRRSDEMLQILMAGLRERRNGALLGFYGDHLPSLPRAFAHYGFDEPHSDYAIWPAEGAPPRRADLPAHDLGRHIVDHVLSKQPAAAVAASL
jgi:hypothetical protein